jgi:FdhD protein
MNEEPRELQPTLDPGHPLFGLGYAKPVEDRAFLCLSDDDVSEASATVAEETPVAVVYNGVPHVVMMCTPADIEDFAFGFTITEEIVADTTAIGAIRCARHSGGIEVAIAIPAVAAKALRRRPRSLVGRTGCGLCGVTTIDDALRPGRTVATYLPIAREAIFRAGEELPACQRYNAETNAIHAAGWAMRDGRIILAREDVGRHNALDKLVGAMLRKGIDPTDGFAVVTSRASYELVQKCAVAGIALLAAVSRPTGLAIRMAEAAGITLAALLRGHSVNVYSHPERVHSSRLSTDP